MRVKHLAVLIVALSIVAPAAAPAAAPIVQVNADAESDYNHIFPNLVVDPSDSSRLVAVDVKRLTRGRDGYAGTCLVHTSSDAGATWSSASLPIPSGTVCRRVPPPTLSFGAGGMLYVAYYVIPPGAGTAGLPPPGRILVARSSDGGATFGDPVPVTPAITARVGEALGTSGETLGPADPQSVALAADLDPASRDVHVAWSVNQDRPLLWVSTSRDGGVTWSEPAVITVPKKDVVRNHYSTQLYDDTHSVAIAVAGGRVFFTAAVGGCNLMEQNVLCWTYLILFSASDDRGATWSEPVQLASPTYYDTGSTGAYGRPSIAVDRANPEHVYIVYDDGFRGSINYDVYLLHSGDGGNTWAAPLRIADAPYDPGYPHHRPAISVAPNGRVDVAWYDGRHDPASPIACKTAADGTQLPCTAGRDVYIASSTDHGATFEPNRRVTPVSFSAATREMNARRRSVDAAIGSIGLASTNDRASLVWEQSRTVSAGEVTIAIWDLMATSVAR